MTLLDRLHAIADRIGELMTAQRDAGLMALGGQPYQSTGSKTDPVETQITLTEIGIDKHLADRLARLARCGSNPVPHLANPRIPLRRLAANDDFRRAA